MSCHVMSCHVAGVACFRMMGGKFVHDDTYPDGSVVQPGAAFEKRWTMLNTGEEAWTADTKVGKGGDGGGGGGGSMCRCSTV